MIPIRVYVENFMSYRQGQELLFDCAPLWVLAGENGTGKSTIFDAITFALYGICRGKVKQEELINHQEDNFIIEFDFLIGDKQYRIRRTVPRKGFATRQISEILSEDRIKPISNTDKDKEFRDWISYHIALDEKAFTSCVLLSQGQSEKLLSASKDDRKEVLEKIIDISAYKQLHERADDLRKDYDRDFRRLTEQLENIPLVSSEQLQVAQEKLNQAKNNYQAIQDKVEKLNQLIQQAKQWEQLQQQIEEQDSKKQGLQQLIDRSEEITTNFNRLEELKSVIPRIENIITDKKRLANTQQEINNIEQDLQQLQHNLTQAEAEQKESHQERDRLQQSIDLLQNNLQQVTNSLSEIAPLITKLEQYEQIKSSLKQCDREIVQLPSDLSKQVETQEKYYQQLTEIKNTLPWLKDITESRSDLSNAIQQQQTAEEKLRLLESKLTENKQDREQLNTSIKDMEQKERGLSERVNIDRANYKRVQKQLQSFEKAATQPTCELCGQEITPEHAQHEKQRLNQNLADIEITVNNSQKEHSTAKEKLSKYKVELENVTSKITDLEQNINRNSNLQQQAEANIQRFLQQLNKDWENLLPSDRLQISTHKPNNESEWLRTQYPNNADLETLTQQVNNIKTQKQNLDRLLQQLEQWKQLNNQRQTYHQQLVEYEEGFSLTEAQQAKESSRELKRSQEEINQNIQQTKQELESVKQAKENIDTNVRNYLARSQQLQIEQKGKQASYSEIENNLQIKLKDIPEQWHKEELFNSDQAKSLEQERERLVEYETLAQQLDDAQQSLDNLISQIKNCQRQIEQLPEESHCPSQEIEQKLIATKAEREKSDNTRNEAQSQLNELEKTQKYYKQLEENVKKVERNRNLYKTLSDLLGKKGIQLHILRDAEKTIIEIANEILDNLSRGKIRLELRGENEETDKALDLIAYNFATGENPTAVALTSGSQRFRIAVSLALAIGQYVGNSARNIESVIIDEGFGSLDKNGRDDMIEELNELKQRLKRIILVSHQEEFFNEFSNGYQIQLVEGVSQVSLLESSF